MNETLASLIGGAMATGVLLLVGWPVARLTQAPAPWIASWIAGVVALHSLMLVSQMLGIPVRLDTMAVGLAACGGAAFVALRLVRGDKAAAHPSRWQMGRWGRVFLASSGIVFGLRAFLQPLAGADTSFRWDFLARQLTMLGHLDYYPPRTAEDFAVYFYPDGMSPLVAVCHWWTYAVRGAHDPSATYAMVTLTYVAAIVISARLGSQLGGRMGGQATVLALVGAPIFFWAFVQGQETGFTALGVVASLCYLRAARRGAGSAVMAGLAMALVVLAREYGWAFFASGLAGAVWLRVPARRVAWFMATVLILAGPWYVRNWWLSGNPFYSLAVGSLFPINEVHAGMLKSCRDSIGWSQLGLAGGTRIAGHLVQLAPVPLVVGAVAACVLLRRHLWLILSALVGGVLWIQAVNYTSGGAQYSYRVLSPVVAVASVTSAIMFAVWCKRPGRIRAFLLGILFVGAIYGLVNSITMPVMAKSLPVMDWLRMGFVRPQIQATPPLGIDFGGRVLSDNAYLHAEAARFGKGAVIVPVWSPEVRFLFDRAESLESQTQRLAKLGITRVTQHEVDTPFGRFFHSYPFFVAVNRDWPRDEHGMCVPPSPVRKTKTE